MTAAEMDSTAPSLAQAPRGRGVLRSMVILLVGAVLLMVWLWCLGAIWYSNIGGPLVRGGAVLVFAAALPIAWRRLEKRRIVLLGFLFAAVAIIGLWQLKEPRNDRAWVREMAVLPYAEVDGDLVHISNVRNCRYRSVEEFELAYDGRTYDLNKLASVDFLVEPIWEIFEGSAHTMVAFGFEDGQYVAISVELRREQGEHFNPIAGMFRQYELMYVIGDERDLIRLRTNHRRDEVYLYPIAASSDARRALFLEMIGRANRVRDEPEFYHTFLNSCTTNIADHVNSIVPGQVPLSYKVLLPGYSGRLAYDLGLIDTSDSFEETRRRCRIDKKAQRIADDDPRFSRLIRDVDS